MPVLKVKSIYAEKTRKALLTSGHVDKGRRIITKKGFVEIPILKGNLPDLGFKWEILNKEAPVFYFKQKVNFKLVRESLVKTFGKDAEKIKGGWELIGDILIIDLPQELKDKKYSVGEKLLQLFPKVKTIGYRSGISGEERKPKIEVIAGESTETIHKENYCAFKIDIAKVMFSAGNIEERRRMAFVSNRCEVVLDMFAGIGQFTIPIAKHSKPKKVYAVEKNPVTYNFLKENIVLNKLHNVEAILGDCRDVSPESIADRVIMGYFFNARDFLPTALKALRNGGIIHFHELSAKKEISERWKQISMLINEAGYKANLVNKRIVKSYAPSKWHVVYDIKI